MLPDVTRASKRAHNPTSRQREGITRHMHTAPDDDAFARALRPLIRRIVAEELARATGTRDDHYTSRSLPPGKTRRWFREHAREIPGAYKSGAAWIVSREAYERWCRERTGIVPTPSAWSPEAALDAVSRGPRR